MIEPEIKTQIFTVRCTIGQEKSVANLIDKKASLKKLDLRAILIPETLRGYIFVESPDQSFVDQAVYGIPHIRGRISGKVEIEELDNFLIPRPSVEGLDVGDIVEITSGPFKGTRAKVIRVNETKEEVTVELLESIVPIPIKVHGDFVKVTAKREEEEL